MEATRPPLQPDHEDWIGHVLREGPTGISLDALETDPDNILIAGDSSSGEGTHSSEISNQAQDSGISGQQHAAFTLGQAAKQESQPAASTEGSDGDTEEAKRLARMQRNRESAHNSRQRKKLQTHELDRRCQELQTLNTHLTGMVSQLTAEVSMLRHQLVMVTSQQQAGAPPPAMAGPMGMQAPAQYPYFSPASMPAGVPMMVHAPTPKVPIQKLQKPSRPAPAPSTKAAKHGSTGGSAAPVAKRMRTIATASAGATAVLALCALALVSGPGSVPNQTAGLSALPELHGAGRSLQALDLTHNNNTLNSTAIALAQGDNMTHSGSESPWMISTNASGWRPVALHPYDKDRQALALQQLKDLAPVAMILDWDKQSTSKALTRAAPQYNSFPQLAQSVLGQSGLLSPASCREMFSFDATSLVDVGAARAALRRYLADLATFKGRNLGALPLAPIGGRLPSSEQQKQYPRGQTIGCGEGDEVRCTKFTFDPEGGTRIAFQAWLGHGHSDASA
ncbi:hypothetical protein WJX73_001080 [Symbiochloris irregularis]|uniref:BZIP domain-containing protein n=1 Tax=Symbiochloris irregularis TaxID=706552 RepID=A0AAW1P5Y3_9CHLO